MGIDCILKSYCYREVIMFFSMLVVLLMGIYLILEACLSMKYVKDKRRICQIGRIVRILIGLYIVLSVVMYAFC